MIDKVKIGGLNYSVELVEGLENRELTHDLGGQINYQNLTIAVESRYAEQLQKQIFVHEMMHGVLLEAGFTDHEEEMCDRIGKVLYQVLADNDFSFLLNK